MSKRDSKFWNRVSRLHLTSIAKVGEAADKYRSELPARFGIERDSAEEKLLDLALERLNWCFEQSHVFGSVITVLDPAQRADVLANAACHVAGIDRVAPNVNGLEQRIENEIRKLMVDLIGGGDEVLTSIYNVVGPEREQTFRSAIRWMQAQAVIFSREELYDAVRRADNGEEGGEIGEPVSGKQILDSLLN